MSNVIYKFCWLPEIACIIQRNLLIIMAKPAVLNLLFVQFIHLIMKLIRISRILLLLLSVS